jgi:pimeloyl-ACP methyl ester carboxylesterase
MGANMTTIASDLCRDAVVVLPGIMGSELVEAASGDVLWGLSDPGWYVKAWMGGSSLQRLAVTEEERSGRTGRMNATRTLRAPAFAPFLRGFEPYTQLLAGARRSVVDPAALREFAYDWRLAIDHNAGELARIAEEHLTAWRKHPKGSQGAQLVLVAHSMGGLVARYFTEVLGGARDVRVTATFGTPFYGAVKAVVMLSTGRGAPLPLPQRRLVRLARTLPGLHDLLPSYRCVDEGVDVRRLNASDIHQLGGDREMAQQAFDRRAKLLDGTSASLHSLVGVQQPTMQSLTIADGTAEPLFYECTPVDGGVKRTDRRGDGTVYRGAAALQGAQLAYLPQSHSALASSEEGIAHACAVMTQTMLGPPLGDDGGVGVELPDVMTAGESFDIVVKDVADPAGVTCDVERVDHDGSRFVDRPYFTSLAQSAASQEASIVARTALPKPGLYRVKVWRGAPSAVSHLILAVDPRDADDTSLSDLDG